MSDNGTLICRLDISWYTDPMANEPLKAVINDFLERQGLGRTPLPLGAVFDVYRRADGTLWLHTEKLKDGYPACDCGSPSCKTGGWILTEPLVVPLTAAIPALRSAWVKLEEKGSLPQVDVDEVPIAERECELIEAKHLKIVDESTASVTGRRINLLRVRGDLVENPIEPRSQEEIDRLTGMGIRVETDGSLWIDRKGSKSAEAMA